MTSPEIDYTALDQLSQPYLPPASPYDNEFAKRMGQAFLTSVIAVKALDWTGLGKKWAANGFNTDEFNSSIGSKFKEIFRTELTATLVKAALHGSERAQQEFGEPVQVSDSVINNWASVYAGQIAEQVGNQSTLAIQAMVNVGINSRLPGPTLGERAMQTYGLDPKAAAAYQAYTQNKTLPKNTTLLDMLASMLVQRGEIIGTVHTIAGINFGHQLVYMQAMESGQLLPDARKVWVTALDERVCPTCAPMDGVAVPVNEPFTVLLPLPKTSRGKNRKSTEVIVPPVHPNCRCTIVTEDRLEGGIITRTARKRGDYFSSPDDLIIKWDKTKHPRDEDGRFAETWDKARQSWKDADKANLAASGVIGGVYAGLIAASIHQIIQDTSEGYSSFAKTTSSVSYKTNKPPVPELAAEQIDDIARHFNAAPQFSLSGEKAISEAFPKQPTLNMFARHVYWETQDWTMGYRHTSNKSMEPFKTLMKAVEHAPVNEDWIYRGITSKTGHSHLKKDLADLVGKLMLEGTEVEVPMASWSSSEEVATKFAKESPDSIVMRVQGAKALNISSMSFHPEKEWLTSGTFKVVSVESREFLYGLRTAKQYVVTLSQVAHVVKREDVEKFSPFQARDAAGKFTAGAAGVAATAAGVRYLAVDAPIVHRTPAELNPRLRQVDARLKTMKTGTYMLPRSYLDAHRRAWGFRIGQEQHVQQLTDKIAKEGFKRPITLHVYNDQSVIWDGQHRLEASYRLGKTRIPTRVVRINSNFEPFQAGVLGYLEEKRTQQVRQQIKERPKQNVGSLKITQTPRMRTLNTINRAFIARGEGKTD